MCAFQKFTQKHSQDTSPEKSSGCTRRRPYIDYDTGKSLGIYVKFQELKNSFSINPGSYMIKDKNGNYKAMNCDKPLDFSTLYPIIKDYLTTDEQEMFETFIGIMDMFSMDNEAKESMFGEYMDMFKEMF